MTGTDKRFSPTDYETIEAGLRRGQMLRSAAFHAGLTAIWHWLADHLAPAHHHGAGPAVHA